MQQLEFETKSFQRDEGKNVIVTDGGGRSGTGGKFTIIGAAVTTTSTIS